MESKQNITINLLVPSFSFSNYQPFVILESLIPPSIPLSNQHLNLQPSCTNKDHSDEKGKERLFGFLC